MRWAILAWICVSSAQAANYFPPTERSGLGFEITRAPAGSKLPRTRVFDAVTGTPLAAATSSFDEATRTLTVEASGYVALKFHGVPSETDLTVYLRPQIAEAPLVTAKGIVSGWKPAAGKAQVIGSIVVRALEAWDLVQFDSRAVLSPYKDTINVLGKREIPSNIVLPDQNVSVVFGSIRVNKPDYRLLVFADRKQQLATVQGAFMVGDILSAVQTGKFTLDLLNKIRWVKSALSRELTPSGDFSESLELTQALSPQLQVQVPRAPFEADVLVLGAQNLRGDRTLLVPTDMKTAYSLDKPELKGAVTLSTPDSQSVAMTVAALAIGSDSKSLSGVFAEPKSNALKLGDFLAPQQVVQGGVAKLKAPARGIALYVREASATSGPIAMEIVFPSAGEREIAIDTASHEEAALQLEFGANFDERTCSGTRALAELTRFQRLVVQKKKN